MVESTNEESVTGLIINAFNYSSDSAVAFAAANNLYLTSLVSPSFSNKVPATEVIEPYYSFEVSDLMNLNSLVSVDPIVIYIISG
jgi:hypothetical protein